MIYPHTTRGESQSVRDAIWTTGASNRMKSRATNDEVVNVVDLVTRRECDEMSGRCAASLLLKVNGVE